MLTPERLDVAADIHDVPGRVPRETVKSIEAVLAKRPVDRDAVDDRKRRALDEVRAYRLRELREALRSPRSNLLPFWR